jgi:HlyD family secretion protein
MNVKGIIETAHKDHVLAVPVDAVMNGKQVYVQDSSVKKPTGDVPAGFRAVKVKLGISDGEYMEVLSGLSENDKVYAKRDIGVASDGREWVNE